MPEKNFMRIVGMVIISQSESLINKKATISFALLPNNKGIRDSSRSGAMKTKQILAAPEVRRT